MLQAQILKIDKSHLDTDSSNYFIGVWDGTFSMDNTASTDERQITFLRLRSQADLVYIGDKSATIVLGDLALFRRSDEGRFLNNASIHLRRVFFRSRKFTPVTFIQFQYAENRNLLNRQLYGAGYQWNIMTGKSSLHAGFVPFLESEKWRSTTDVIIDKQIWKINIYLGGDLPLTPSLNLNTITYFQTGYDQGSATGRNRIFSFIELKQSIGEDFKAKVAIDFSYDQKPIIPQNNTVYQMNFGMEYHF